MNRMPKDRQLLFTTRGMSADDGVTEYADKVAEQRSIAAMPDGEGGWSTSGSGFSQDMEKAYLERLLAANGHLDPFDPHSPIQRMNQPMAANISTDWKKKNGDYRPAKSFKEALLDDQTGGSFKDTLKNQSDGERQEWLNQNHGGRGMGYMGQNAFHRQPSAYGPGTTNNMDERRANVQANAQRFFRNRGYRI